MAAERKKKTDELQKKKEALDKKVAKKEKKTQQAAGEGGGGSMFGDSTVEEVVDKDAPPEEFDYQYQVGDCVMLRKDAILERAVSLKPKCLDFSDNCVGFVIKVDSTSKTIPFQVNFSPACRHGGCAG